MGDYKKVNGNDDPESEKRIKEEVKQEAEQIKKGEITKIYPILKPGDWVGVQAGAIKQTLWGTKENPKLVAGFGYDAPSNFIFLTQNNLEGKDQNEMIKEAYHNLENYKQEFEIISVLNGKFLFAAGQDFSSEKMLCKSHMMKAHKLLNSDELLVSIPRRRTLMVTSRKADKNILKLFAGTHKNAWEDTSNGNAPIVDALFAVKNGDIDEILPQNNS